LPWRWGTWEASAGREHLSQAKERVRQEGGGKALGKTGWAALDVRRFAGRHLFFVSLTMAIFPHREPKPERVRDHHDHSQGYEKMLL
jgi:hypothetical protein